MKEIRQKGILYAIYDRIGETREGSNWYGSVDADIQAAKVFCNCERKFKPHAHIFRERVVCFTQEVVIVIKGGLKVTIYNKDDQVIEAFHLLAGDIAILYTGGHAIDVLEDNTIFYEVKHGQFVTVDEDKRFI